MGKKLCGVLLALVLALSLLPTVAVADTVTEIGIGYSWTSEGSYFKLDTGNYKLISNVEVTATILVTGNVTLDLNGYVLNLKSEICNIGGGTNAKGSVIQVGTDSSVGHLTLQDSNKDAEHTYTVDSDGVWKLCTGTDCSHTHSTLTGGVITGGYIDSNEGSPKPGSGVYVVGTNGSNGSSFTMEGGSIIGCKAANGGGVLVRESGCIFTMNGGLIAGCTADSGGGVTVGGNATFTMTGGTIRDCKATTNKKADALCIDGNGTMEANGGHIYGTVLNAGTITTNGSSVTRFHDAVKLGSEVSCPDFFEVTVNDLYYQSFMDAWNSVVGDGPTFKLLKDVTIPEGLTISRKCTVDLNGCKLTGDFGISAGSIDTGNRVMSMDFSVEDSSENALGILKGTVTVDKEFSALSVYSGTVDNVIVGNDGTSNASGIALYVSGGTINTVTINNGGTLYANGGTIKTAIVNSGGKITHGDGENVGYTTFENSVTGSGNIDDAAKLTVTFNLNGGTGTAPEAQGILKGQKATEPEQAPTAPSNCVFGGWYTDSDCTNEYDFSSTVANNLTLYAKWVKTIQSLDVTMYIDGVKQSDLENAKVTYDGNPHTVTFVIKDGNYTLVKDTDYTVTENTTGTTVGYYGLTVTGIGKYAANTSSDNSLSCGWQITAASTTGNRHHYVTRAAVTGTVIGAANYTSGNTGLTFKSSAAFSSFQGVQVDGKTIDSRHYIAEAGSIEVYLKATYLQTLAAGKHTVTILSTEGNVTMDFTVGGVTSAKTFDAGAGIYAVTALLSYTGTALVIRGRKRK